jgi:hypothetical protein
MSTIHRIALVAAAVSCVACTPAAGDAPQVELGGPVSFPSGDPVSADEVLPARGLLVVGDVTDVTGQGIPDARVCNVATAQCARTDAEGAFTLAGLEDGVAELLRVHAAGYFPAVVPIEMSARRGPVTVEVLRSDEYALGDAAGAVRFVDWTHPGAAQPALAASLVRDARDVGDQIAELTPRSRIAPVSVGQVDVRFTPVATGTVCTLEAGWSGPSFNTATLPIIAGAITQVSRSCVPR